MKNHKTFVTCQNSLCQHSFEGVPTTQQRLRTLGTFSCNAAQYLTLCTVRYVTMFPRHLPSTVAIWTFLFLWWISTIVFCIRDAGVGKITCISAICTWTEILSIIYCKTGNFRVQENFANFAYFRGFANISCREYVVFYITFQSVFKLFKSDLYKLSNSLSK